MGSIPDLGTLHVTGVRPPKKKEKNLNQETEIRANDREHLEEGGGELGPKSYKQTQMVWDQKS